ncbi:hypothetical protein ACWGNZ_00810 [Sphingomonas zeae]
MSIYFPKNHLQTTTLGRLAAGALAYSPTDSAWLIAVQADEEVSHWVSLSGERPFRLHTLPANDQRMVLLLTEEWRMEVAPETCIDGSGQPLARSQAFRSGELTGFGATVGQASDYHAATIIGDDGGVKTWGRRAMVAYFSKWRIVTGDQKDPFVICEVDSPGWGS